MTGRIYLHIFFVSQVWNQLLLSLANISISGGTSSPPSPSPPPSPRLSAQPPSSQPPRLSALTPSPRLPTPSPSPPSPRLSAFQPSPRPPPPLSISIRNPLFLNNAQNWTLYGLSIYVNAGGISGGNYVQIRSPAPTYSTVSQMLSPFDIGQSYSLGFYVRNPSATNFCSLLMTIGSTRLLSTNNTAIPSWTKYNLTFIASTRDAILSFSAYNTPDYYYISGTSLRASIKHPG